MSRSFVARDSTGRLYVHSLSGPTGPTGPKGDPGIDVSGDTTGQILVWNATTQSWTVSGDRFGIGSGAGSSAQQLEAIAIGSNAGSTNQGIRSIAIGAFAGSSNQPNNSIVINATNNDSINASASGSTVIAPIRAIDTTTGLQQLWYDPNTGEIFRFQAP